MKDFAERQKNFVTLNCSGQKFRISISLLDNYPLTKLGTLEKREEFWDPVDEEYFFDRHYYAFRAIFDFYRTGKLRRPIAQGS